MKHRHLRLLSGLAVVIAASGVNPPPASATSTAAVAGGGSVSPGLTGTPTDQHVTFSGVAVGVMDTKPGTCTFSFATDSNDESVYVGSGAGFGGCYGTAATGGPIGFSCSVSYSRVGTVALLTGACYGRAMFGVLVVEPTSVLSVTSFLAQGTFSVLPV